MADYRDDSHPKDPAVSPRAKRSGKRRRPGEGSVYWVTARRQWCGNVSLGRKADGRRDRRTVYGVSRGEVLERLALLKAGAGLRRTASEPVTAALPVIALPPPPAPTPPAPTPPAPTPPAPTPPAPPDLAFAPLVTLEPAQIAALPLSEFLDLTFRGMRSRVRPSTYEQYTYLTRRHVDPYLGSVPIKDVTPHHFDALFLRLEETGVSTNTRKQTYAAVRRAVRLAVKKRVLPFSPLEGVEIPKPPKKTVSTWTEDESRRFLEVAFEHRLFALFVVALTTGMRFGEILGLQWREVNLKGAVPSLSVRQALVEVRGRVLGLMAPKTQSGLRAVTLPEIARVTLLAHRNRSVRDGFGGNPYVFPSRVGTPLFKSNVRTIFYKLCEKAGVPRIRFHDQRHTSATLLLGAGENVKVIQERLGHSDIRVTLNTYAHATPTMQHAAAARMDAIFPASGSPSNRTP